MAEKKTETPPPVAPAAPAPNAEVEALKAQLAQANAKLAEVTKAAASGVPFDGEYLKMYHDKIAAGLTAEQARVVTQSQIQNDIAEAEAAKAKAAK